MSICKVAELCNLSIATVSRVINTPEKVQFDTRLQVERAMRRLNYRGKNNDYQFITPDTGSHMQIAFFVPDTSREAMQTALTVQLFDGVSEVCFNEHQELFLCRFHSFSEPVFFENRLPSGIIHKNQTEMEYRNFYSTIPQVVCLENSLPPESFDMVMPDSMAIGGKLAEYCRLRHHSRIVLLRMANDAPTEQRCFGIRNALQNMNVQWREVAADPRDNFAGIKETVEHAGLVVFVGRDEVAVKIFTKLALSGTRWLDQTDYLPIVSNKETGAMLDNRLSLISYNAWEIGKTAAEIMLMRLRSVNNRKVKTLVQPELIVVNRSL